MDQLQRFQMGLGRRERPGWGVGEGKKAAMAGCWRSAGPGVTGGSWEGRKSTQNLHARLTNSQAEDTVRENGRWIIYKPQRPRTSFHLRRPRTLWICYLDLGFGRQQRQVSPFAHRTPHSASGRKSLLRIWDCPLRFEGWCDVWTGPLHFINEQRSSKTNHGEFAAFYHDRNKHAADALKSWTFRC